MAPKGSSKGKARETPAPEQGSSSNPLPLREQIIQEEAHETVLDLPREQDVPVDSRENDPDASRENDPDPPHETPDHSQDSNTQDNSGSSDPQFMSLEELRERDEILQRLVDNTQRLRSLNRKHGRSESLDIANLNPSAAKRQTIFKPTPHTSLYKTTDYSAFRQFISRIESSAEACQMNDSETVAYATTGLEYSEKELWKLHIKNSPAKKTWEEMISFLLLRMGDPANRIRNAWRTLFRLRKKEEEDHYQWLHRFQQHIREIGDEFENSDKLAKHLFLWGYDKAMRNKLDEQADLPDHLRDIAAIATRLQATLNAEKSREPNKPPRPNQPKQKPNTANNNAANTNTNSNGSAKHPRHKNNGPAKPNKEPETPISEITCYNCGKKGHYASSCSEKPK